jgi:hypothetical protein
LLKKLSKSPASMQNPTVLFKAEGSADTTVVAVCIPTKGASKHPPCLQKKETLVTHTSSRALFLAPNI